MFEFKFAIIKIELNINNDISVIDNLSKYKLIEKINITLNKVGLYIFCINIL